MSHLKIIASRTLLVIIIAPAPGMIRILRILVPADNHAVVETASHELLEVGHLGPALGLPVGTVPPALEASQSGRAVVRVAADDGLVDRPAERGEGGGVRHCGLRVVVEPPAEQAGVQDAAGAVVARGDRGPLVCRWNDGSWVGGCGV